MRLGVIALLFSAGLAVEAPEDASPGISWRLPDEAIGIRMAPILLLSRPDIQRELALSGAQADGARRAILELYVKAASIRGRTGPEAVAARRAVDEAARSWIADHLSDEQRSRLEQIDLQWEGPAALLNRPTIAASLDLSEAQRSRLAESLARVPMPGEAPISAHRRRHRDAAALLTDEQRLRWLAMLGSPFEPGTPSRTRPISSAGSS